MCANSTYFCALVKKPVTKILDLAVMTFLTRSYSSLLTDSNPPFQSSIRPPISTTYLFFYHHGPSNHRRTRICLQILLLLHRRRVLPRLRNPVPVSRRAGTTSTQASGAEGGMIGGGGKAMRCHLCRPGPFWGVGGGEEARKGDCRILAMANKIQ